MLGGIDHWWIEQVITTVECLCVQVQFVAGVGHAAQSIYVGCPFPLWMQWALIIYGASVFALFINFYFQAYIRPTRPAYQVAAEI